MEEKTNVTADASATTVPAAAVPSSSSEDADAKAKSAANPIRKPKAQPLKDKSDSEELTKRLNKLALERQKNSVGDRLRVIQSDTSSHLSGVKTFQELNLPSHLLDALFAMGFDRPSAIQEEALPRILANPPRNLIGQAQSGSGKTAAFTLGMLYRIEVDSPATTQAICVSPTRELAVQIVQKAVIPMAANMTGLKVQMALSGEMIERGKQVDAHIIVGTPGKVVDWLKRKQINPKNVKVFVLDEADTMVDGDGHRANSIAIKKHMPKTCQSLFFSATFPKDVVDFASKMVVKPDKILIETEEHLVLDVIKQLWIDCQKYEGGKRQFLADIYSLLTIGQSIVFVATKKEADVVGATLIEGGYRCSVLHGQIDNLERDRVMDEFRCGKSNVLITTNVLARGVDVDNVCLVINYDVPTTKSGDPDFETYLHRIGRTGRFGRKGTAINLISDQRALENLAAIEAHFSSEGKEMIQMSAPDPEELAESIEI